MQKEHEDILLPAIDFGANKNSEQDAMAALEASQFLGVSRQALYEAAGRQEVPHRRIGKRYVFSRRALVRWLSCDCAKKGGQ